MLSKATLQSIISNSSLCCIECLPYPIEDEPIEFSSLDQLIFFAKSNQIKTLLFFYSYATANDLLIDEKALSKANINDSDFIEILSPKVGIYNAQVEQLNFDRPISLHVFCIHEGFIISYSESDYWFEAAGFLMPERKAIELANENFEIVMERKESKQTAFLNKKRELMENMLNDTEFHKCTNQYLRREYGAKLFGQNRELIDLFSENHASINVFVDNVWHEYKSRK